MKIVVLDDFFVNFGGIDWSPLSKSGAMTFYQNTGSEEEIIQRVGDAEIVFTNRVRVTDKVMQSCPNIRLIQTCGTGLNAVDVDAAKAHGITVCNVPAYGRGAVAQMAVALMMAVARNTAAFDHKMKTEGWHSTTEQWIREIPQIELSGKTLGIIGMGDIGYAVAQVAIAMEMKVLAHKRTPDPALESEHLKFVSFDTLLAESDVISIHCPLNESTRGLVNADAIAKMKQDVILINTARGPVVDEAAVVAALDSGKIFGVGTDVFCHEPVMGHNALAAHPKCVATPHAAWMPLDTRQRIVDIAGANLDAFLAGKPQNNV